MHAGCSIKLGKKLAVIYNLYDAESIDDESTDKIGSAKNSKT
jgi:hypothetical protein